MTAPTAARPRFALIQSARGTAAIWVVLFHIEKGQHIRYLTAAMPAWLTDMIFRYGSAGVAIFFVLSGFVIAHSLSGKPMDGKSFAHFALRRSIRLDPPYWVSMILAIAITAMLAVAHGNAPFLPGMNNIVIHFLYLQEMLGTPEIQTVYWTLTYEIQFYLILAAACWLRTALEQRGLSERAVQVIVFGPLVALAFFAAFELRDWAPHGLFVNLWHGFFVGVLAYQAGCRRNSSVMLFALCGLILAVSTQRAGVFGAPCAITALLLFAAARTGYLEKGLSGTWWQAAGAISYSLYLVHVPVLRLAFGIWQRLVGRGISQDAFGLVLVFAACMVGAMIFWWLIERPSHKLASLAFVQKRGDVVQRQVNTEVGA